MATMQADDLASQIQRLADIEAIRKLKAECIRLVDSQQWKEWGELLSEDCEFELDGGASSGRDTVVAKVSGALANAKTVHRVHEPEVIMTGADSASARWPMSDFVRGTFGGKRLTINGHGYYHEDYVRTADGWRVKRSQLIRQFVEMVPTAED